MHLSQALSKRSEHVRLVAIAGETLGHEEFAEYWDGELFFDVGKRHIWPVLQTGFFSKMGVVGGALSYYLGGSVSKNMTRFKESSRVHRGKTGRGIKDSGKGEGYTLGGLWVFGSPSQGMLYEFKERSWGDHAQIEDVLAAVAQIKEGDGLGGAAISSL